jgi:uncharacterized membrane protein YraQ (UPF0718 family)
MKTVYRTIFNLMLILCVIMTALIIVHPQGNINLSSIINEEFAKNFKTIFISIFLEALPFLLIGVFLSSLLQIFISEQTIQKWVPKNPFLAILFACMLGIVFPICECGIIPVIRRLIKKGVPVYAAFVFILTGPIINPVVFMATWMAFRVNPSIVYWRMGLAFIVAVVIGLILYRFLKMSPMRSEHTTKHEHDHIHSKFGTKLTSILDHTSSEFFEMGKYLLFGSILTAVIQSWLSREALYSVGNNEWLSQLFMMGYAYVLSLCSTSDAFIAATFSSTFSAASLLTFMVFGPMLDFKATIMLLSVFKTKFVLQMMALIAITVMSGSLLLKLMGAI